MKNDNLGQIFKFILFTVLITIIHYRRNGINGLIKGYSILLIAFLIVFIIKKFINKK